MSIIYTHVCNYWHMCIQKRGWLGGEVLASVLSVDNSLLGLDTAAFEFQWRPEKFRSLLPRANTQSNWLFYAQLLSDLWIINSHIVYCSNIWRRTIFLSPSEPNIQFLTPVRSAFFMIRQTSYSVQKCFEWHTLFDLPSHNENFIFLYPVHFCFNYDCSPSTFFNNNFRIK